MDGHKDTIAVADVAAEREAEVVAVGSIGSRQGKSDKRIRQLQAKGTPRHFVYAAGPWGDWR